MRRDVRGMNEHDLQNRILLALSASGATVWRQNTGLAWVGEPVQLANGDVLLKNPRRLHVGLCKGSSDIIGLHEGRFIACEVKAKGGRVTREQENFIAQVNANGGSAGIAWSVDDALRLIR